MLSEDAAAVFRAAVSEAARKYDRRSELVKRSVFSAVDELKAAGVPPERIIVLLRELIRTTPGAQVFPSVGDMLAAWCAERYYGPRLWRNEPEEPNGLF